MEWSSGDEVISVKQQRPEDDSFGVLSGSLTLRTPRG